MALLGTLAVVVGLVGCSSGNVGATEDGDSSVTPDDPRNSEDCTAVAWYLDGDGDGFGAGDPVESCEGDVGWVTDARDCDDTDPGVHPDAVERCDGADRDEDCDGQADDLDDGGAIGGMTVWPDRDGDSWGDDAATPIEVCDAGDDVVPVAGDCDDVDPDTYPGAAPDDDPTDCLRDADGDGFGDALAVAPILAGSDCDDGAIDTYPGVAPADHPIACMRDADDDGYGDAFATAPITAGSDCDDADDTIHLDAVEVADDGIDQDCDGRDATEIRFYDGFELGVIDAQSWPYQAGDATVEAGGSGGVFSLVLGSGTGEVRSLILDTSPCSGLGWVFWARRGPESPDQGEYLHFEYWTGSAWHALHLLEGGGGVGDWVLYSGTLVAPVAMHAGFQVRFRAEWGNPTFDHFWIDDVAFGCL